MANGDKGNETANAIIAQALQNAGVPPREINVPAEAEAEPTEGAPTLDGGPKGQVRGEQQVEEPEVPAEKSSEPKPAELVAPPLSKAEIETAITEATSKFQSIMDKKINSLTFQMQQTVGALNQFFQAQETPDISGLPEGEQVLKRLERLEKPSQPKIKIDMAQPVEQQTVQYYQRLTNFVDTVGLKVDDKRIDWAPDVSDPQEGFTRFLTSIKKALTDDQTKVIQELRGNGDKEIAKLRKKTGVDQISKSGASGAGLPDIDKMTAMQKIEYGFQVQEELAQANK